MVGDVVRAQRRARQWTQTDLAARAGIGQSLVSQIERNAVPRPSLAVWQGLARAFDLTVDELRHAAGVGSSPSESAAVVVAWATELARLGRALSGEQRDQVLAYVRALRAAPSREVNAARAGAASVATRPAP